MRRASAAPEPEKSPQEKQALERLQILDVETDKLIDLFARLVESTKISSRKTSSERESLQTSVNASQLVQSCERLVDLVGDLKKDIVLHDYQRYLHKHVKQVTKGFAKQHEQFLQSTAHQQWQSLSSGVPIQAKNVKQENMK